MDVSFIILAWNSERYLEKCLASIATAMRNSRLSYEIRVLDNGSHDGTADLLRSLAAADRAHVIPHYERENLGTTRSRNLLCAAARGDYLCVMDSDVELPSGVIEPLLETLAGDPEHLGIVVPRILYPNGKWQKSIDRFPTLFDKVNRFLRLREIEEQQARELGTSMDARYVDYAISAFWMLRRDLLESVGMLDERIFYAPEDVDFCLRVWQAGYRILYLPVVAVIHHTQEISRGFKLNRAKLSHVKGLAYYFFKHGYLLRRPRFATPSLDARIAQ